MIRPPRNRIRIRLSFAAAIFMPVLLGLRGEAHPKPRTRPIAAIHGVVFMPNGMLAPGARVSIHTLPRGKHWTAYTDEAGDFLQSVPVKPARYRLRATEHGFAPGEAEVSVPGPIIVDIFIHLHKKPGTKAHH